MMIVKVRDHDEVERVSAAQDASRVSDPGLIAAFHKAMLDIYQRATIDPLLGYTAGFFGLEVTEHGGLETARRCIHSKELGAGFIALYKLKRLDLTLEALIHDNPRWHPLFSEDE